MNGQQQSSNVAVNVKLDKIELDPECQPRAKMDDEVISEYMEALATGAIFPPVVLFKDAKGTLRCADGFHRVAAYRRSGKKTIPAKTQDGEKQDAILYSLGANASHGLRRTNADKRRSVETALRHWPEWSDREVAKRCGVSDKTVGAVRRLTADFRSDTQPRESSKRKRADFHSDTQPRESSKRKRVDKHGRVSVVETKNIGPAQPESSTDDDDPDRWDPGVAATQVYRRVMDDINNWRSTDYRPLIQTLMQVIGHLKKKQEKIAHGIGAKDGALWSGGVDSTMTATTVFGTIVSKIEISWKQLGENWELDAPASQPAGPDDHPGTCITVMPICRSIPDGTRWTDLLTELGYLYAPAINQGAHITVCAKGKGARPVPLTAWKMPQLLVAPYIDEWIEVGSRRARVQCGIVKEGVPNHRRGISYVYRFRVIKPASGKGCGDHNFSRIVGVVTIDDSWRLTKNKDEIINAEGLYDAVERVCTPVFEQGDKQASELASAVFTRQVEGVLNQSLVRARRSPQKKHGAKKPTGDGTPHSQAASRRFKGRCRGSIHLAYDVMDSRVPGEYADGTVTLNLNNPMVLEARDRQNVLATAAIAAAAISIAEVTKTNGASPQMSLPFSTKDYDTRNGFAKVMGELMASGLGIDGTDVLEDAVAEKTR